MRESVNQHRGGSVLSEAVDWQDTGTTEREITQLLSDWRTWHTAFGAAASTDAELNLQAKGSYGPAGLIFTGAEWDKTDIKLSAKTFRLLRDALVQLRNQGEIDKHSDGEPITGFQAWASLIEPYLSDPADPGIVAKWRKDLEELAEENRRRARSDPPERPRVALLMPRRFLECHDAAIEWLRSYLEDEDLYVIFARPMSAEEEKAGEDQNTEILAVFNRLRASGMRKNDARDQAAEYFHVHPDMVDRILEFRADIKPDECLWHDCDRAPFSQNLCMKHYQRQRRAEQKQRESA